MTIRAVLVAIAIPIFTSQLEKSRDAVTISNVRGAYAMAQAAWLTKSSDTVNKVTVTPDATDAAKGTVTVEGVVGKGTQAGLDGVDQLPTNGGTTWTLTTLENANGKAATLTFTYENDTLKTVVAGAVS